MELEAIYEWLYRSTVQSVAVLALIWLAKELWMGMCKCQTKLDGKTVVITGGSFGIGFEAVVDLAKRGAKVIIGCRSKADVVKAKIKDRFPDANVEVLTLDLASKSGIDNFVDMINDRLDTIDILINNAGIIKG